MMLIGAGGIGNSPSGGGSSAVSVWYGAAQNVPDVLVLSVAFYTGGQSNTTVSFRGANGLNTLLTANGGNNNLAGVAMTANQFTASGFFQSVAGQAGTSSATITSSATTFLGGGVSSPPTSITANYGYFFPKDNISGLICGYFQLQPIIVGSGGGNYASGGIGCGGGGNSGQGGNGLVLIASW